MGKETRMLTTRGAAEMLNCSTSYLEKLRVTGGGPPYHKIGSKMVRYSEDALEAWTGGRRFRSTSEATISGSGRVP